MKTIYKINKTQLNILAFNTLKLLLLGVFLLTVSCKNDENCGYDGDDCGGSATNPKVDLIVIIDTSGSMGDVANSVSSEASAAITAALKVCKSDLRVEYFGVDGTWAGTNFTTSHRSYLTALHGTGVVLAADQNYVGLLQEQGANAVEDLSKLFNWRNKACRVIFYISDEELDSSTPKGDFANENAVTANAIAAANENSVTVFANYITDQNRGASILANYTGLTNQTGGSLYTINNRTLPENYYTDTNIFGDIICNACNACKNNQ